MHQSPTVVLHSSGAASARGDATSSTSRGSEKSIELLERLPGKAGRVAQVQAVQAGPLLSQCLGCSFDGGRAAWSPGVGRHSELRTTHEGEVLAAGLRMPECWSLTAERSSSQIPPRGPPLPGWEVEEQKDLRW